MNLLLAYLTTSHISCKLVNGTEKRQMFHCQFYYGMKLMLIGNYYKDNFI